MSCFEKVNCEWKNVPKESKKSVTYFVHSPGPGCQVSILSLGHSTPNGTMAPTRSSWIWLKKIKVVHTLLNRYSPKYQLSTPNSFVTIGCFRGDGVPVLF